MWTDFQNSFTKVKSFAKVIIKHQGVYTFFETQCSFLANFNLMLLYCI